MTAWFNSKEQLNKDTATE